LNEGSPSKVLEIADDAKETHRVILDGEIEDFKEDLNVKIPVV